MSIKWKVVVLDFAMIAALFVYFAGWLPDRITIENVIAAYVIANGIKLSWLLHTD